jgi:hypothetical protein
MEEQKHKYEEAPQCDNCFHVKVCFYLLSEDEDCAGRNYAVICKHFEADNGK